MTSTAPTRRRGSTPLSLKALLIAGFLLGAAATVMVVVFSDQVRWLRIGVLLALWAALCAAFAVARSRREAQSVSAREAEITRTYQLELHREVSARREYESALTDRVRTEVETMHADELTAVRAQLERLTAALSNLLDGDVLVERLTLSAESTRLRGLTQHGRTRLADLSRPELGRRPADDDDAIDAELIDDEPSDTAAADSAENTATQQPPVQPRQPSLPPRPDAPSTAWTRRHRKDVARAAAIVAADRAGARGGHELDSTADDDGSSRISVAQLLAALGSNTEPSRRRRAAD